MSWRLTWCVIDIHRNLKITVIIIVITDNISVIPTLILLTTWLVEYSSTSTCNRVPWDLLLDENMRSGLRAYETFYNLTGGGLEPLYILKDSFLIIRNIKMRIQVYTCIHNIKIHAYPQYRIQACTACIYDSWHSTKIMSCQWG